MEKKMSVRSKPGDGPDESRGRKNQSQQKKKTADARWIARIVIVTVCISILFSFAANEAMDSAGYVLAGVLLAFFIALGIAFDIIGVAITSCDERPFHSMASHKEKGAAEALKLLKNADKAASVCNDVVGDISGIVSGSTSAVIAGRLVADFSLSNILIQLVVSGVVAGLTIGGKAAGKSFAINKSKSVVYAVGRAIAFAKGIIPKRKKR